MKSLVQFVILLLWPAIAFSQTVHIGDILCTDGSIVSSEAFAASGRTAEGVVFYVDATDSHGWVVSLDDQSSSIKWSSTNNYGYDLTNLDNYANARFALHDLNGQENTGIIRSHGSSSDFPAAWAVDYDNGWYLPSAGQLRYLYSCAPEINTSLQVAGGAPLPYHGSCYWWSSTEHSGYHAFDMNTGGSIGDYVKDNHVNYPPTGVGVRQIKDFAIPNPVHPTYHIGDLITNDDGSQGILFYLTPDQTDGWMVALEDASTSVPWGNGDVPGLANQTCSTPYGTLLDETDGFANTGTLRGHQNGLSTAANTMDYEHGWYLPTAGQLSKLFGALPFVEDPLQAHGSTLAQAEYWSSSEVNADEAFTLSCVPSANIRAGHFAKRDKTSNHRVRAVRNLSFVDPPLPNPTLPDNIIESDCNQPLQGNTWDAQLLASSPQNDIASYSPILAGDIDGNGVVDLVISHYNGNNYRSNTLDVYSGTDLTLQYRFNIQDSIYHSNGPYALGKYPKPDGSLQGAIFVHGYDKKIRSYTINGTLLNVSDRATSCDGMVSFADFNGDGYPEVYTGSDVFDAATLKWLCSGPENGTKGLSFRGAAVGVVNHHRCYFTMSLASNVLGDERQELICGNTIYNVNIVSRTNPALNSITVNKIITPPTGFSQDGHVSLADLDLDGECDVLVVRDDTDDHTQGRAYYYAYRPSDGQILFQKTNNCLCEGYPLVGNIDDDPHPEIVFLEKQEYPPMYIYCWRYTSEGGLTTVWRYGHNDTSGQTGITLFDFNQDNIMEIVYRDSENLRIINGNSNSPHNVFSRRMAAGTGCEYPIVADINGDGSAEIIATGLLDQYSNLAGHGAIHVFGSPGNWSPARPVWNQYMYHVTNVNEDLTIPTFCFDKATVFTGSDGTIRRPYNNFLQQAYYITPEGEPYNPGGSIEVDIVGSGCNSYTFHGVTYDANGHYEQLIETPEGCDTLYNIEVNLGQTVTHEFWKRRCESYTWNDTTYTESGTYTQEFVTPEGCDSIATLHLTIIGTLTHEWAIEACDHYTWNGVTYTEPGDYVQEFESYEGCDSIVTLHFTLSEPIYHEWSIEACDRYKWNDITYTEPGDYVQEFVTLQECDSIVTLHLAFTQAMEVETDTTACGSFSWAGQQITQSGNYDHMFVTPGGCDSLVHLHLTVEPYPEAIGAIEGPTEVYVSTDLILGQYFYSIEPVGFADHYEWTLENADWPMDTTGLNCALWVTTAGDATLRVKAWNGCGYTEREILIHAGFYDIDENLTIPVAMYPNPAHDRVFIEADDIERVRLFNLQGQCLMEQHYDRSDRVELPLYGFESKLYLIEIQTSYGIARTKLKTELH